MQLVVQDEWNLPVDINLFSQVMASVTMDKWTVKAIDIQLKSEVYIHLSQIHLNSVFHNS